MISVEPFEFDAGVDEPLLAKFFVIVTFPPVLSISSEDFLSESFSSSSPNNFPTPGILDKYFLATDHIPLPKPLPIANNTLGALSTRVLVNADITLGIFSRITSNPAPNVGISVFLVKSLI